MVPIRLRFLALCTCLLVCSALRAQDPKPDAAKAEVKPIRALLITGGCCHDYAKQKKILPEAISAKANVTWTIVHQGGTSTKSMIPFYEQEDWAKGYDIVVHNECFADAADPAWTAKILKPHREGVPAVVVHCAMHCYRDKTDEWFKFLGVTSRGHGANYPFEVINLEPKNPIMEGFGEKWTTPKGELYNIEKVWPTATPLAHAMSRDSKKNEVCIWTNMYNGNTKVFGTTIGHHNEEMDDPVFVNYMTRGLLWACGKLNDDYLKPCKDPKFEEIGDPTDTTPKKMGEPTPAKKTGMKVLRPKNLATGKKATASATQKDDHVDHKPENALDGDLATRWCPHNGDKGHWWQVDLGKPEEITGVKIVWEHDNSNYRYLIEGSADGKTWKTLSDQTKNDDTTQEREHKFNASDVRYVKITTTGLQSGSWGSFWECEVLGKEMVETIVYASDAPKAIKTGGKSLLSGIKVPAGFEVSLFAAPPQIGYPTCLATSPDGAVFIGIDENGSIDAKTGRGRVVRAIDTDNDGVADDFKTFASMDSPRGLVFNNNTLYVQHPPFVTAFHDDNGDGVSDRSEVLVEGLGFDLKFRGADHTTNGMALGIDGFLYIAVGDYGYIKAKGKDGTELQLLGGGVTRVRTDGSGLEIVSRGQRNIYDVAVDPLLNLFTRDNTNDGGGWNVRLSHVIPSGQYGYPSLFINFAEEIVHPLADYGGGSPCGSLFIEEAALPEPFGNTLYTCDWGRSIIYRHPLTASGAGYAAQQEAFVELPRPTDMEVDANGNIYIASWRDGGFTYSGPNVGYVVRVRPESGKPSTIIDFKKLGPGELAALMGAPSHFTRLHAQREILRRGDLPEIVAGLEKIAAGDGSLTSRVAAIFTLSQLRGSASFDFLRTLAKKDELREFALRAMADDKRQAGHVSEDVYVAGLSDSNPRVRLVAAWGLARINPPRAAVEKLIPLVADADPLVSHVAIHSLIALKAGPEALAAFTSGSSALVPGLRRVLQALHDPQVVSELIAFSAKTNDPDRRRAALVALCRLNYQESPYTGDWWGTRPDTTGPYYKHQPWAETNNIGAALRAALAKSNSDDARWLFNELKRHKVELGDQSALLVKLAGESPAFRPTAIELLTASGKASPAAIELMQTLASDHQADKATRLQALRTLYRFATDEATLAAALQVTAALLHEKEADGSMQEAWHEFARDAKHAGQAEYFVKQLGSDDPLRGELAYQLLLGIDANPKASPASRKAAVTAIEAAWEKPASTVALLRAIGNAQADAYVLQIGKQQQSADAQVAKAANYAATKLDLGSLSNENDPNRIALATLAFEVAREQAVNERGDQKLGARLFVRQGCSACHTVKQGETLKGPHLGGVAAKYKRPELVESILKPSAKIAQGFETQWFQTGDGLVLDGFVTRESGEEVELRNNQGAVTVLPKSDIEERGKREISIMPNGLVDKLTTQELAALLAYLESLK